jgi:type IV secretory pathway component VirB8
VREAGNENGARGKEMRIAMSSGLTLIRWQNFRFLQNFSGRDFAWLLIGVLLAVAVIWALSRRRRRWF